MKIIKTEGIVLRKVDFSEADRIITVFTKENGKKIITLKGIRKSKRRDSYGTDPLVLSDFVLYEKDEISTVSSVELKEPYTELKKDINKINIATYLLVLLDKVLNENEQRTDLYSIIRKILFSLSKAKEEIDYFLMLIFVIIRIIKEDGIVFSVGAGYYFNFDNGGIEEFKSEVSLKISEKQKQVFLLINPFNIVKLKEIGLRKKECLEIINILENYIEYNNNVKIKINDFYKEAF